MNYIGQSKTEIIANDILIKTNHKLNGEDKIFPIKVDHLVEDFFDLDFDWIDLDGFSKNGIVWAAIDFSNKKIYMNEAKERELTGNPGMMNFTIAHEIGHWVLHQNEIDENMNLFDISQKVFICQGDNKKDKREWQADFFAANLLMPRHFFIEKYRERIQYDDSCLQNCWREFYILS